MTVEVVAQDDAAPKLVVASLLLKPALSRLDLAVLFLLTILGQDKGRLQADNLRLFRRNQQRRDEATVRPA